MLTTTNRAKSIDYNVSVVFMNKNTFLPIAPSWRVILNDVCIQIKKTWSQSCHSFHVLRPSHCPVSRNEQRWKPHVCVYITLYHYSLDKQMSSGKMEGMDIIHPMKRPRCFVFDLPLNLRDSRIVKTKAQDTPLSLCMCPPASLPLRAFSKAKTCCKGNAII